MTPTELLSYIYDNAGRIQFYPDVRILIPTHLMTFVEQHKHLLKDKVHLAEVEQRSKIFRSQFLAWTKTKQPAAPTFRLVDAEPTDEEGYCFSCGIGVNSDVFRCATCTAALLEAIRPRIGNAVVPDCLRGHSDA